MSSMYENCECFEFHDVILILILGPVFTFASNYHQTASFFRHVGHINKKKSIIFGQLASAATVVFQVSCWHRGITVGFLATSARTTSEIRFNSCWE